MNPLDSLNRRSKVIKKTRGQSSRVNFLSETPPKKQPSVKKFERPKSSKLNIVKIVLILTLILLITAAMYFSEIVFSTPDSSLSTLNKFNPFSQLARLITSPDKKLSGENKDRINFLLLGVGGIGHEGPYLTDTIMLASIKPSTSEVALISLPRDLIVPVTSSNWQKINHVYALAKASEGKGGQVISDVVEKTLDLKIHYFGVIDFSGFEKFIDDLGGLDINVERSFVDEQYPTEDFLTTSISFEAGPQTMDGATALTFVRSRHGTNGEGSDFARNKRQQLILQAIRDKVISFSTLLSPKKISSIFELLENHLETNLSIWQAIKIGKLAKEIDDQHIYRLVLDDSPGSLLEPAFTEDGAYVLQPKDGNYQKLQLLVNNIFDLGKIKSETAKIEVQNGTETTGLAYYTSTYLEKMSYNIINYSNAPTNDYQRTIIYDFTDGEKKDTLKSLKEELDAYLSKTIPDYIHEKYQEPIEKDAEMLEQPDLLVILGFDHSLKFRLPEETPGSATSTDETATSTDEDLN